MKVDLPKQYNPKNVEDKFYKFWEENGFFHAVADKNKKPYTIVIPPPNVTSVLHMGHGLNNTIQDILIRFKRMQGYAAEWMPGTDHAGIATQNIVEKELAKEGKTRKEVGRDAFVKRVWQWKEQCESRILAQLKKIGCSCDWERTRFTMDEGLSQAVRKVFVDLYKKGLVYKGRYIINWCPRCETALSDEEAEHEMHKGNLWYIRYPVKDTKEYITVATTRPETMLGDTAVAVNPKDKRFKKYIGKTLVLPLADREIPVIADDFVDPEFGTGAVKVTPAHDPNDFEIGRRHNLTPIVVMDEKAVMNADAGLEYQGMDRYEAREKIIIDLEEKKLLERIENHEHSVGHCYRCHTVVEPYISEQWFVKMKPLAEPALKAVKTGKVKIYPERWVKVYCNWLEGIRDWCISRQIWWGHRIPVWYCKACNEVMVAEDAPVLCTECGSKNLEQDKDVLDTWFSSWLWPFSTFGWPEKNPDLNYFYPTNTLSTASEIIFFWVARMIMAGYEFMGKEPFKDIYIHGTVRDEVGRKMSKSLGNGIDPIDVVEKYGADALRFSVIIITAQGQDVFLSDQKFEIGRNFTNKIWNASRFLLMFMEDFREPDEMVLTPDDKYILYRLAQTAGVVNKSFAAYRFNDAAQALYEFIWHEFCDKYIETVKPSLYGEDISDKNRVRSVLLNVLEVSMQLLHPIMPFITEEIWQKLYEISGREKPCKSIMVSNWPDIKGNKEDSRIVKMVEGKYELVKSMRNLRSDHNVPPSKDVDYIIKCSNKKLAGFLEEDMPGFKKLVKGSSITFDTSFKPEGPIPTAIFPFGNVYMTIESAVDISSEKSRLEGQLAKIEEERVVINKKLSNRAFLKKAPKEVVDKQKEKKKQLQETSMKINASLKFLSEKSS
ncbi:MAG: valine--tRNA ligase [Candidatus Aureabacteria bacterium]|nr:valine--tRNA ligase [Candidatus Auribacterota bacterium]